MKGVCIVSAPYYSAKAHSPTIGSELISARVGLIWGCTRVCLSRAETSARRVRLGFDRNPANEIDIVNGSDFTPDRSASENPKIVLLELLPTRQRDCWAGLRCAPAHQPTTDCTTPAACRSAAGNMFGRSNFPPIRQSIFGDARSQALVFLRMSSSCLRDENNDSRSRRCSS